MPRSKQTERRMIAKLKAELTGQPWAIDVRALGALSSAIEAGNLEAIRATLSLGNNPDFSITRNINGIAVIPVTGVLQDECNFMVRWGLASSYQLIEREFNQAMDNSQVRGVLFYANSPGGSAIGCKRVGDLVFESRGIKPVRTFVQGVCCSAMYYIAAATDRIDSTPDSLVGSIGTILPHMEMAGMLKEFGIGATVFTNAESPKKGHGNVYEPLSDDARKTLQQFVDSYGGSFVADVARYRGISTEQVVKDFGQGDAMRADIAIGKRMIDAVVSNFEESLDSISSGAPSGTPSESSNQSPAKANIPSSRSSLMNERIKAQLFALGLIESLDASDKECTAALTAWCKGRGQDVPSDEANRLAILQASATVKAQGDPEEDPEDEDEEADEKADEKKGESKGAKRKPVNEQDEARLADLHASAELFNEATGYEAVTLKMVQEAHEQKLTPRAASKEWAKVLAEKEPPIPGSHPRITGEGSQRFAADVVDALVYKSAESLTDVKDKPKLSDNAEKLVRMPLWAIAGECLRLNGRAVDMYGDREYLAEAAMQMGTPGQRHTFFSSREGRQYISAGPTPAARPGDFPNILSSLANKFLDTVQLDDDFSYPLVSAVLPGGLSDFKPAMMVNKGIVEELDEVQDAEQFQELGLSEEVLSYIFLRRFGNKWGWTPVMIANDDLGAFVEGMIGLEEAWQVTQNRLVVDRFTANETLLDGAALFADRTNTGAGTNPAANNNLRSSGNPPSDTEWGAMETLYADIGGIATGRRVRGSLNVAFVPTGSVAQEARRTFLPLNTGGLEMKVASTTSNVGLYRGEVQVIPESELRTASTQVWYGLRNPTRLNTATVVRAYFNGFGTEGRRERWYDPENKTTWVSIEGRIAVAVKNWRYAVRNAGTGAG